MIGCCPRPHQPMNGRSIRQAATASRPLPTRYRLCSRRRTAADRRVAAAAAGFALRAGNRWRRAIAVAGPVLGRGGDVATAAIPKSADDVTVFASGGAFLQSPRIGAVLSRIICGVTHADLIAADPRGKGAIVSGMSATGEYEDHQTDRNGHMAGPDHPVNVLHRGAPWPCPMVT